MAQTPLETQQLIITADDYGVCNEIDAGIIRAIKVGRINSVAAFVVHKGWEARLKKLIQLQEDTKNEKGQPSFGIGLHFSMTSGEPASGLKSSLVDTSNAELRFHLAKGYPFRDINPADIENELLMQLGRMATVMGGFDKIDSISNHHGVVYFHWDLFVAYANIAKRYNIPVRSPRSWYRFYDAGSDHDGKILTPAVWQGIGLGYLKKPQMLSKSFHNRRENYLNQEGIPHPSLICDLIYGQGTLQNIYQLLTDFQDDQKVKRKLKITKFAAEFMMHLYVNEGDLMPDEKDIPNQSDLHGINQDYFEGRNLEYRSIVDDALQEQLDKIDLAYFRQLLNT